MPGMGAPTEPPAYAPSSWAPQTSATGSATTAPAPQPPAQRPDPMLAPAAENAMAGFGRSGTGVAATQWPPQAPVSHPVLSSLLGGPSLTSEPAAGAAYPPAQQGFAGQQSSAAPTPAPSMWAPPAAPASQPLWAPPASTLPQPGFVPNPHQAPPAATETAAPVPVTQPPAAPSPVKVARRGSSLRIALLLVLVAMGGAAWFFRDQVRPLWLQARERFFHKDPVDASGSLVNAVPGKPVPPIHSAAAPQSAPAPAALPQMSSTARPAPPVSNASPFNPNATPAAQPQNASANLVSLSPSTSKLPVLPPPAVEVSPPAPKPEVAQAEAPAPKAQLLEVPKNVDTTHIQLKVNAPPVADHAVQALKDFFNASTWQERIRYVQLADLVPEEIRHVMQAYYSVTPDGPIAIDSMDCLPQDKEPLKGPMQFVFKVSGPGLKEPLPVMVEDSPNGYKVDWLTFTEFKDNLLLKFAEKYTEGVNRFHVAIHREHYFDSDVPDKDNKLCFAAEPPMPGYKVYVFVDSTAVLARELERTLDWNKNAFVIAEIRWRKQDNYQWLELAAVQYGWRNNPPPVAKAAEPSKPATKQVAKKPRP